MAHKFLDDVGARREVRPDKFGRKGDKRKQKWAEQRKIYGFDERETWAMDCTFRCWLYERLRFFLEVAPIRLDYHKFTFKDKEYTQGELIDMMLERLEFSFKPEYNDFDKEQEEYVNEIQQIWALVMPCMWW